MTRDTYFPVPFCNGAGSSPGDRGEGYVHNHSRIHGIGSLEASAYDWKNPVGRIVIRKVND